jgi:hypothetical protein
LIFVFALQAPIVFIGLILLLIFVKIVFICEVVYIRYLNVMDSIVDFEYSERLNQKL